VTSGFQVVLGDLRRVAGAFGTESVTFWGIMPPDGPEGVSGGSPELDEVLAQLLEAIGGRHTELAASIAGHGRRLREAYKNYQAAEETVGHMVDRIMDHGAPG
jgi:Family of unknown function (DUF6317)